MSKPRTILAGFRLPLAAAFALVAGCSGGTSRESARDQATTLTCQQYVRCMAIGAGKAFPTQEDCQIQWAGTWDNQWPAADCEGKINEGAFQTCLAAIRGTSCNLGDLLITLGKCGKANVCASASPDGG
jgi:hypothetical protein